MKIRIIAAAFAGLVTLAATAPASAQANYREHRHEHRIHRGDRWQDGRMHYRDGRHLRPHDRRVLRNRQTVTSRHIYRHEHWQHHG